MKVILVYLVMLKSFVQGTKKIKILDISDGFKEREYDRVGPNRQNGGNVNYTLKCNLKITKVVDRAMKIWVGHHAAENCTYCHVTNHKRVPAIIMLFIEHFNSFFTIHRYRKLHGVWVPITRRLYNEIEKVIAGFKGEEYDLELHIDQELSPSKVSVSKQESKLIKSLRITPNVGFHVDIVVHGETILWQRNETQDEAMEVNLVYERGSLAYVSIMYEDYYCYGDTIYYRYYGDDKWVKINRAEFYHKPDNKHTLLPYNFPPDYQPPQYGDTFGDDEDDYFEDDEEDHESTRVSTVSFQKGVEICRPKNLRRYVRPLVVVSDENQKLPVFSQQKDTEETQKTPGDTEERSEERLTKRRRRYEYDEQPKDAVSSVSTDTLLTEPPTTVRVTSYDQSTMTSQSTVVTPSTGTSTVYSYSKPIMSTKQVQPSYDPKDSVVITIEDSPPNYTNVEEQDGERTKRRRMYDYDETPQQGPSGFQYPAQEQFSGIQFPGQQDPSTFQYTGQQDTSGFQYTGQEDNSGFHYIQQQDPSSFQFTALEEFSGIQFPGQEDVGAIYEPYYYDPEGEYQQHNVQIQEDNTYIQQTDPNYLYNPVPEHTGYSYTEADQPYVNQESVDQNVQQANTIVFPGGSNYVYPTHFTTEPEQQQPQQPKPTNTQEFSLRGKGQYPGKSMAGLPSEPDLTNQDPALRDLPDGYSDIVSKNVQGLENDLDDFENRYLEFEEEDQEPAYPKRRRGDRDVYHEKKVDFKVQGSELVSINLLELDDANPDYDIELQLYKGVPIFKIIPRNNILFREIISGFKTVWANQDVTVALALKVAVIEGEYGAVEIVLKKLNNTCYHHYKYERGYYRAIHTPTYINHINKVASEIEDEERERLEKIAREEEIERRKKAEKEGKVDPREQEVRDYEKKRERDPSCIPKKKGTAFQEEAFALGDGIKSRIGTKRKRARDRRER